MHPVDTTGAEGSKPGPLTNPLDKPPKKYTANENRPVEEIARLPFDLPLDNEGDLSKKFV